MQVLRYGKKHLHRSWQFTCYFCDSLLEFDDDDKDIQLNKYEINSKSQTEIEFTCPVCQKEYKVNADINVDKNLKEFPKWKEDGK